jgi:hypothetical protein
LFWFDRRKKSKFDTRMHETMAKKTAEQDAASDQEEARRTRESLSKRKDFALKRSQSKGSKGKCLADYVDDEFAEAALF